MCRNCTAIKMLMLGILILINIYVWPQLGVLPEDTISGWLAFSGILLVLGGIAKFVVPQCKDCMAESAAASSNGKKRKR